MVENELGLLQDGFATLLNKEKRSALEWTPLMVDPNIPEEWLGTVPAEQSYYLLSQIGHQK